MSRSRNNLSQVKLGGKIIKLSSFIGSNTFGPPVQRFGVKISSKESSIRFLIRYVPMKTFDILNEINFGLSDLYIGFLYKTVKNIFFLPKVSSATIHTSNAKSCLNIMGKDSL